MGRKERERSASAQEQRVRDADGWTRRIRPGSSIAEAGASHARPLSHVRATVELVGRPSRGLRVEEEPGGSHSRAITSSSEECDDPDGYNRLCCVSRTYGEIRKQTLASSQLV